MSYKSRRLAPQRVDLGDGYWADLVSLSMGVVAEYTAEADANSRDKLQATCAMLAHAVRAWNLDEGEDGAATLLPITAETIADLDAATFGALAAALTERMSPLAAKALRQD